MPSIPNVNVTDPAALAAWLGSVRALVGEVRALALDATSKRPHRIHARA